MREQQAYVLLQEFEAENGEMYIREDRQLVYLVPEHWSDARYQSWVTRLGALYEHLYEIAEQREAEKEIAA